MKKNKLICLVIFLVIISLSCSKKPVEIPNAILTNIWIPSNAQDIKYYFIKGTYQVSYKIKMCYPALEFINQMISEMNNRNWQRLDYDFLNPEIKMNHKRGVSEMWSHFKELNGKDSYQWIDDWEDASKNIIRYILRYKATKISEKSLGICDLQVIVVHVPKVLVEQSKEE